MVESVVAAIQYIKNHPVTHVILNLHTGKKETRQAIEDIYAEEPKLAVFAMGRSYRQVLEDNKYFLERGIEGTTFTFEQFIGAARNEETERFISIPELVLGVAILGSVAVVAAKTEIKIGRFLANFWFILLSAEFLLYVIVSSFQKYAFRQKMKIPVLRLKTHGRDSAQLQSDHC